MKSLIMLWRVVRFGVPHLWDQICDFFFFKKLWLERTLKKKDHGVCSCGEPHTPHKLDTCGHCKGRIMWMAHPVTFEIRRGVCGDCGKEYPPRRKSAKFVF